MANPKFREIVSAQSWDATSRQRDYVHFANKNKTVHQYEGGNGVKIGYTENSGRTLVASAERGGESMICVVMSAPDWFNDAYKLMDYGFGGGGND
jgi:D-alanyl-D-alanine carboxypeptidase (penicillin-binding protein 5/6)